jgi:hypothetical protein
MCAFLSFVKTVRFNVIGLSFLVAWIGRIALVRTSEMAKRFGLYKSAFIPWYRAIRMCLMPF